MSLHPYDRQRLRMGIEELLNHAIDQTVFELDGGWSAPVYDTTTEILRRVEEVYGAAS